MEAELTERQYREKEYHQQRARAGMSVAQTPISLDVVKSKRRRWWNAYWSAYDILLKSDLRGKKVLVPGCGFGEDAVRIAALGAEVFAFDLSPEMIEICRSRVAHFGYPRVNFDVMACEDLAYETGFFDVVFCMDILHHVDITKAAHQFRRVLKPGGRIVGDELYTHSIVERFFRQNYLVDKILYPRMVKFIYRSKTPYITEDEHKIDENEFSIIRDILPKIDVYYYNLFIGRILSGGKILEQIDRIVLKCMGKSGRVFAGRIAFEGYVLQQHTGKRDGI